MSVSNETSKFVDFHAHTDDSDGSRKDELAASAEFNGCKYIVAGDHFQVGLEFGSDKGNVGAYTPEYVDTSKDEFTPEETLKFRAEEINKRNFELLRNFQEHEMLGDISKFYRDIERTYWNQKENFDWRLLETLRPDKRPLQIVKGLEMDYHASQRGEIEEFIEIQKGKGHLDTVGGSVHYMEGDPSGQYIRHGDFSDKSKRELEELVEVYVSDVISALHSDSIDAVAHPDLIELDPDLNKLLVESHYEDMIYHAKASGTPLEINARAQDKKTEKSYISNSDRFPEMLLDSNAPFTVASDNHDHENLSEQYKILEELLEKRPYREPVGIQDVTGVGAEASFEPTRITA